MKKQLIRFVCLCLALVVTMGSVGMAATEQICQMAGLKKMTAKAMPDNCCAKKKAQSSKTNKATLNQKCCSLQKQHHKVETPAAEKPFCLKVPVILAPLNEVAWHWQTPLLADVSPAQNNNKSPPLYGTELLKALHEFRV
jgi:hypothetical protein